MKRFRSLLPAIAIFCLALFVRVLYNNTVAQHYYPLHDSLFYQTIGFNIIKEHCFCLHPYISTVYRTPLWPFIMAGLSLIFGPSDYFARLFLCLIGSGTCVLLYLFARDLFGPRFGIIAGVVAAIYPELYIYDGWLYTESLYIFFLFAICYVLFRIQRARTGKIGLWLWCGMLLGLLSLTRPNGIIVIGIVIAWAIVMIWLKVLRRRPAVTGFIAAALLACVLIAPWTVRNYLVSHSFIPVATGDGTVLLGAYNDQILTNPAYLGSWIDPLKSRPDVAKPYPLFTCTPPCEVARENAYKDAAIQWIKSHLSIMPHLLALHFINLWQPATHEADLPTDRFPGQRSSQIVLAMMETFPIPVFILALLGLAVTLWKWRELLFIYTMIALTIGQALVFYGSARFRAPIEPMLILLATGALWFLTSRQEGTLRWIINSQRKPAPAASKTPDQPEQSSTADQLA
ncbi:MAG TPA: glycosyltransferase family 39 protein [Ktedonobacteraceae bacterium]|nr:glycosyltransferase family 39 protein [Ktedonobacteraceae bacterium]